MLLIEECHILDEKESSKDYVNILNDIKVQTFETSSISHTKNNQLETFVFHTWIICNITFVYTTVFYF